MAVSNAYAIARRIVEAVIGAHSPESVRVLKGGWTSNRIISGRLSYAENPSHRHTFSIHFVKSPTVYPISDALRYSEWIYDWLRVQQMTREEATSEILRLAAENVIQHVADFGSPFLLDAMITDRSLSGYYDWYPVFDCLRLANDNVARQILKSRPWTVLQDVYTETGCPALEFYGSHPNLVFKSTKRAASVGSPKAGQGRPGAPSRGRGMLGTVQK